MAAAMVGPVTAGPVREAVHQDPVWRDRANFIIAAELTGTSSDVKTEQLWARRVDTHQFEICCIPFFVYDLALGDIVETDDAYLVRRVVEPSGRFVFRVWFGESFHPRDEIAAQLVELGAVIEWSSPNLLGVDAADEELARMISGWLLEREEQGQLVYETGKTA